MFLVFTCTGVAKRNLLGLTAGLRDWAQVLNNNSNIEIVCWQQVVIFTVIMAQII